MNGLDSSMAYAAGGAAAARLRAGLSRRGLRQLAGHRLEPAHRGELRHPAAVQNAVYSRPRRRDAAVGRGADSGIEAGAVPARSTRDGDGRAMHRALPLPV